MTVTKEDIARVKVEGFLLNRETQLFSGRVVTSNGVFTAAQLGSPSPAVRSCLAPVRSP